MSTIKQLNHATVEMPGWNIHEHPGAFIRSACLLPGEQEPATANRCRIAIHAVCSLEEGGGSSGRWVVVTVQVGVRRVRGAGKKPRKKHRGLRCDLCWQLLAPSLPATSRLI